MRSLAALLKIRAAVLRIHDTGELPKDKRVLDAFAAPGVVLGDSEREIVVCWIADTRAKRLAEVRTLGEFAGCREPAWINQLRSSPLFRRRGARRSSTGRPWLRSPALAQPPRPSRRGVGEAERPHPVVASAGPGRRRVDAVARRAASALARRAREEPAAARAFAGAQRQALAAWEEWSEVVALEPVRLQAERIVTAQPLRAADALQLGAALVAADLDASAFEFVTLDERLATAAEREGFRVLGA
jgi:predicted nucleic acid-binding protein